MDALGGVLAGVLVECIERVVHQASASAHTYHALGCPTSVNLPNTTTFGPSPHDASIR